MKKILLTLFLIALIQHAFAEQVNVKFNFPLESGVTDITQSVNVPNDSNAYTAITLAAQQSGTELGVTVFPFGAFIECVEQICSSSDFTKYWLFSINNTPASIGISDYIVNDNDSLSLDYFEGNTKDALEWIIDQQQPNGQIGVNSFQHAFALMGLALSQDNNVTSTQNTQNAVNYLLSLQQNNASFGDDLLSSASTMALLSNDFDLNEFDISGTNTLQTIASHQQTDGGFKSGSNQSDVDTTSWTIMAFAQAGQTLPENNGNSPIEYLLSAQHANGSFGYTGQDQFESIEFTQEALLALHAGGVQSNQQIINGLNWLSTQQNSEGCIQDGFRTALGAITFKVWGENLKSQEALDCLKTLQNGDGSFGRTTNQSNTMDSAIAVIALSEKTIPLAIGDSNNSHPQEPTDGVVGLNSIIKFNAKITNNSNVTAQDVQIELEGIPSEWIIQHATINHFDEIASHQTKTAEIYVEVLASGEFNANVIVTSATSPQEFSSNYVEFEVIEALLSVELTMEE